MPSLFLKPTHKPVKHYYAALRQLAAQGATHEGAVKTAFQGLLETSASQRQWTLLAEAYNAELDRWRRNGRPKNLEGFLRVDEHVLKWIRHTKRSLLRDQEAAFRAELIRPAMYRPYTRQFCYFERFFNEDRYLLPRFLPSSNEEVENRLICTVTEEQMPFSAQMTNLIPCLHYGGRQTQCFPFYTYAEDGSERRESITDWALQEFQTRYGDKKISKWDIFHYVYAVLHHPEYRARYAANLRRELPRIPFIGVAAEVTRLTSKAGAKEKEDGASSHRLLQDREVFHAFAAAGKRLAELHVGYEQQPEYPLERMEKPGEKLNWRVEKMKLAGTRSTASQTSAKKKNGDAVESVPTTSLIYNDFLTLAGIPKEAFDYRLGNRSALEWVIDQYQVSTDKRSGITNDPNRPDDPEYIVRLLGQVITVSLETMKAVKGLPVLNETK